MTDLFDRGYIQVKKASQNNLKDVSLDIPKYAITAFVGLSGAGKSSLVFDTVAAQSRRELNETFPSFTQQYLPKYGQPRVEAIEHLPVAIVVDQKRMGTNARSTLATYTGIYSLLRLLFSRVGKPFIGYSENFSFNLPQGMCPRCEGLGYVDDIDESQLIDPNRSLNTGAITFVSFGPNTWRWRRYVNSGLFDNNKLLKDYSKQELDLLLHAPQQKLKNPPDNWHKTALYEGVVPRIRRSIIGKAEGSHHKAALAKIVTRVKCPACGGTRLKPEALTCLINGQNIAEVAAFDLNHLLLFLDKIQDKLGQEIIRELTVKIQSLIDIGLGYLSLDRETGTLSGGEAQRIKIAKYLTSSLVDLVYILDEPSVGLHPVDVKLIKAALQRLKDKGNTILIVEHNPEMITFADYIVEIGPHPGAQGGQITFEGTYAALRESDTLTNRWLSHPLKFHQPRSFSQTIKLQHVNLHNLKDVNVDIPLGIETVISGPAGSGKSSLVMALKEKLKGTEYIDVSQKAIGVSIRSTVVTYLGALDKIRKLFGQSNHVSQSLFSYNGKGACPLCKGKGVTITNMAFMDPVVQVCERCHGQRYNEEALSYQYHGKNIAEVLGQTVSASLTFFEDVPEIAQQLADLKRVGLGYLSLSQSLNTLSGGELQRLKLASELHNKGEIYLLDEPTAGLHLQDVDRLNQLFQELVAQNNSLIIIEHNLATIASADWLIDMGPQAGIYGGEIEYTGTPKDALQAKQSKTGQALKRYRELVVDAKD